MGEGGGQAAPSRLLEALDVFSGLPSGVRWLLIVLICFPAANFILMLTSGIGMEESWQSGDWAICGDAVLVRYFWLSWLVFLPAVPAIYLRKLRWPVVGLLIAWTCANYILPVWLIPVIEASCGPRPWL